MELTMTLCGFASSLLIIIITIYRQRRFDKTDYGSFALAFLAGRSIPVALYLCYYGFSPDPPDLKMKLQGYAPYIAFGGFLFLVATTGTIWSLCKDAYNVTGNSQS